MKKVVVKKADGFYKVKNELETVDYILIATSVICLLGAYIVWRLYV